MLNRANINKTVRLPAVAGQFYPAKAAQLVNQVNKYLKENHSLPDSINSKKIKALIVPHAGYIYSGSIAGSAYSLLPRQMKSIKRVVLLGPSHHVAIRGCATSSADIFSTPLGDIPLDRKLIDELEQSDQINCHDMVHTKEHSLEVQLPFLQECLTNFLLTPLVVGQWPLEQATLFFDKISLIENTLIIISTDLSHFHSYNEAQYIDKDTSEKILRFENNFTGDQACGCQPLNALLHWAKQQNWKINLLALKNSGDSHGDKNRVVGYGSFALYK
ncbi:MAG: AmmeMemoRadiSam system protein B [Bermanella sp.]